MIFPSNPDVPLSVTSTNTQNCIGQSLVAGGINGAAGAVWPSANLAFFIPFRVGSIFTVQNMFWENGSTVGTNTVQTGIYDSQGNQLVASTAATTTGASTLQKVAVSITLQPGLYYMAIVMNGTTDTVNRLTAAVANIPRAFGVYTQATAAPLPASATFAVNAQTFTPVVGLTTQAVV